ncbi:hypothetical protein EZV62_027156 [Acer yangbiense]|uniref:Retrotransposon Copia-like N-terminal domain-containing protein n=1 Tax=Acer yangbiense TaxID=1000413 RepID=A0A5C7GU53_9ROSI|nr:hypothetical protein EZV62_027156 [Acer yangbiense]
MSSAGKDDSAVSPSPESTTGKEQGSSTKKDARSREMSSSSLGNMKSTNHSGHPLGSYCSVKLNHENYLIWKNLVLPVIRGNRLEGFITGTRKCPPKYVPAIVSEEVSDEAQENPEHEEWVVQDQILLGWLYNSIEPDVVAEAMGSETSKDLWDSIKDLFGIKTKSNIAYYKKEFQELKKGGMKMSDYLKMAKRLTDNLALAGRPVPLKDLVSQILNGLDSHEYNPLVCQINEKEDISWIDLQAKLLSYEKRLEQMNAGIASINLGQAAANFVGTKNIGGQSVQNRGQGTQEAMETEVVDSQEEEEAEIVTLGLFANFLNTKQAESTTVINAHHWFPTLFPPPQTTPTDTSPTSSCPSSSTSPLHVSSAGGSLPANSPAVLIEGGNDDDDASSNPSPNLSAIPYDFDNSIEEESGYEEITDVQPTEGQGHHMMTRAKMGIHKPKTYPSEYQMFSAVRDQAPSERTSILEALNSKVCMVTPRHTFLKRVVCCPGAMTHWHALPKRVVHFPSDTTLRQRLPRRCLCQAPYTEALPLLTKVRPVKTIFLLRLDLEDPLKEWVIRTVEASRIMEEEMDVKATILDEESPEQIEIE